MQLPRTNTAFLRCYNKFLPEFLLKKEIFQKYWPKFYFSFENIVPLIGCIPVRRVWKRRKKENVAQSCPTLCNSIDYTVHGVLQARILEWVAFPFSRGSSQLKDQTQVFCIAGRFFTCWATREAPCRVWRLVQIGVCGFWLLPQKLLETLLVASFLV